LRGSGGLRANWPDDEAAIDQAIAVALQQSLTQLGFPAGNPDGVFGARTRQAIRAYQQSRGLPADGFPSSTLVGRVLAEAGKQ
jgi:membrane-bound lytic murein transglycosylase B